MAIICWGFVGLSGCGLTFDRVTVTYEIDERLDGTLTFQLEGLSGTSSIGDFGQQDLTAQEAEEARRAYMRAFYNGEFQPFAESIVEAYGLRDVAVTLSNKTPTKCDMTITGTYRSLLAAFGLESGSDFSITRRGEVFSASLFPGAGDGAVDDFQVTIRIRAAGRARVRSHNAHTIEDGYLVWEYARLGPDGINFELLTPEPECPPDEVLEMLEEAGIPPP